MAWANATTIATGAEQVAPAVGRPLAEPAASAEDLASERAVASETTLANVAQYEFRTSPRSPGSIIYEALRSDPVLPGVIIADGPKVYGLLSRERFFQQLSHRFGAALFLDGPVSKILETLPRDFLSLPERTGIHEAARLCLARPRELVYEPVLVLHDDGSTRLLGMYELLQAQSHLLTLANAKIQEQIEHVEAASRAKGDFLANMSHEIRTPLNGVIGMTELLLDSGLSPRQRDYASTVIESCETLLSIINDILDFSKIEAGRLSLERVRFDLRDSLGDAVKSLAVRACRQGIELAFRCSPQVPREILADPVRMRQVLLNLIGNAIKFTHRGEVVLDVGVEAGFDPVTATETRLHFRVIDTGIGIPAEKLKVVFEAFEQADTSTTREYGGTGLGLAIAGRLAYLMDGQLWVESEVGRGSTFHFTARVALPRDTAGPHQSDNTLPADARVLVVEGNATQRSIFEELLAAWKIDAAAVCNAEEAIEELHAARLNERPYMLVVTDANLAGASGFELADTIRNDEALSGVSVLALIAADRAAVARAEQLGIAACLMKPVKHSELFNAIQACLGVAAKEEPAQVGLRDEPQLPPLRILVAEDSLVNQKLAVELLSRRGHEVVVARNGEEALARHAETRFDLILMDVQMPLLDGFAATQQIRAAEQSSGEHIPIIAMTAHALVEDRQRCLNAGMDDYVSKPIRGQLLLSTIAAAVGRSMHEGSTKSVVSAVAPVALSAEAGTLNWDEAREQMQNNDDVLKIVVEAALEEVPRLMDAIHTSVEAGDAAKLRLAAHTLKGALRYFGETPAYLQIFHMENMGRDGNVDEARAALSELERQVREVVRELQEFMRGVITIGKQGDIA